MLPNGGETHSDTHEQIYLYAAGFFQLSSIKFMRKSLKLSEAIVKSTYPRGQAVGTIWFGSKRSYKQPRLCNISRKSDEIGMMFYMKKIVWNSSCSTLLQYYIILTNSLILSQLHLWWMLRWPGRILQVMHLHGLQTFFLYLLLRKML